MKLKCQNHKKFQISTFSWNFNTSMSLIWNSIAWTQSQRESHMASIIKDSITKGVTYGINYQGLNHKESHIWYQLSRTQSQRESYMVSIIKDSINRSQS